jgi:hypothetical protein
VYYEFFAVPEDGWRGEEWDHLFVMVPKGIEETRKTPPIEAMIPGLGYFSFDEVGGSCLSVGDELFFDPHAARALYNLDTDVFYVSGTDANVAMLRHAHPGLPADVPMWRVKGGSRETSVDVVPDSEIWPFTPDATDHWNQMCRGGRVCKDSRKGETKSDDLDYRPFVALSLLVFELSRPDPISGELNPRELVDVLLLARNRLEVFIATEEGVPFTSLFTKAEDLNISPSLARVERASNRPNHQTKSAAPLSLGALAPRALDTLAISESQVSKEAKEAGYAAATDQRNPKWQPPSELRGRRTMREPLLRLSLGSTTRSFPQHPLPSGSRARDQWVPRNSRLVGGTNTKRSTYRSQ